MRMFEIRARDVCGCLLVCLYDCGRIETVCMNSECVNASIIMSEYVKEWIGKRKRVRAKHRKEKTNDPCHKHRRRLGSCANTFSEETQLKCECI